MSLIAVPFNVLFLIPMSDNKLMQLNTLTCHIIYFPISILLTLYFIVIASLFTPFAYVKHAFRLIKTLTASDESMDELSEKLNRVFTIVIFILGGPFILVVSNLIDIPRFWYNLYTKPTNFKQKVNTEVLSKRTIGIFATCCKESASEADPKLYAEDKTVDFVGLNKKI